jgi:HEPN domain-containing protein
MATKSAFHYEKDKWLRLAVRHLRMAVRLSEKGLYDGASFHTYHSFECSASAFLAFKDSSIPPDGRMIKRVGGKKIRYYPSPLGDITDQSTHKVKILIFKDLADKTSSYYAKYMTMSRFSNNLRNSTLYYNSATRKLPSNLFSKTDASDLFRDAKSFFELISKEIK